MLFLIMTFTLNFKTMKHNKFISRTLSALNLLIKHLSAINLLMKHLSVSRPKGYQMYQEE